MTSIGRNVVLWDIHSRKRASIAHPLKHPAFIDFSSDGARLAVKNGDGEIHVLDVPNFRTDRNIINHSWGEGCQLLFSPCNNYLIDGSWKGQICVRDAISGKVDFLESCENSMITHMSASADRDVIAYVVQPKVLDSHSPPPPSTIGVRNWPFTSSSPAILSEGLFWVWRIALSPDASQILVYQQIGPTRFRLDLCNLNPFKIVSSRSVSMPSGDMAVAWGPDANHVACVEHHKVTVFETPTLNVVYSVPLPYCCYVEFSPDGSLIALGSWEKGLIVPVNVEDVARSQA